MTDEPDLSERITIAYKGYGQEFSGYSVRLWTLDMR